MDDPFVFAANYQRQLFAIWEEFFERATGMRVTEFATFDTFALTIRNQAERLGPRYDNSFPWLYENLGRFYETNAQQAVQVATELAGMKLVLGGGLQFTEPQLQSVSRALLFADTILIPDPVLPWVEIIREEERFPLVMTLQAAFGILHLKPIIDADLRYPAVFVFPSFEKTREAIDEDTQNRMSVLICEFFTHYFGEQLASMEEACDYAANKPDAFISTAQAKRLVVAPDGPAGETIEDGLKRYSEFIRTRRTPEWISQFDTFKTELKVANVIIERLSSQYHLLEYAEELRGHPLLALPQPSHYFKLVAAANTARLEKLGLMDMAQRKLVESISEPKLSWLSNVPVNSLVEIRKENENVAFRKQLEDVVRQLHDATVENTPRVAAELAHNIVNSISEHDRKVREVQKRFAGKHLATLAIAASALGSILVPTLAPFLAVAPIAALTKYAKDKYEERQAKAGLSRSLTGVISSAYEIRRTKQCPS